MAGWRIIDCVTLDGEFHSARGQVIISSREGEQSRLPTADVAVILVGPHVRFSTAAMHRLLKDDVAILFTDWKGVPEGGAYAWSQHTRVGARQLAQMRLTVPRRKNAWGRIIRAKVAGQAHNLELIGSPMAPKLWELAAAVRSGDPSNIEAQAARLYWSALFEGQQFIRDAGSGWGLNACLDYGYTVLRGLGIKAVLSAGLAPGVGLFHRGRSNAFNLVDDVIEPYRPAIDAAVARLPPDVETDDRDVRHLLVAAAMQPFEEDGTGIAASLIRLSQALGNYAEGEISKLPVPVWNRR
ncbi:MAG: type II CRISPR-associated endonuclease Cas1 [Propionibacteriaceae bacterium]